MADTLTISLEGPLAENIRAAAQARGLSPEDFVRKQLAFDIALDDRRSGFDAEDVEEDVAAAEEFDRTGVGIPWEEVRDWMSSWGTENELPPPEPRKLR
jgi:hypothetical protein